MVAKETSRTAGLSHTARQVVGLRRLSIPRRAWPPPCWATRRRSAVDREDAIPLASGEVDIAVGNFSAIRRSVEDRGALQLDGRSRQRRRQCTPPRSRERHRQGAPAWPSRWPGGTDHLAIIPGFGFRAQSARWIQRRPSVAESLAPLGRPSMVFDGRAIGRRALRCVDPEIIASRSSTAGSPSGQGQTAAGCSTSRKLGRKARETRRLDAAVLARQAGRHRSAEPACPAVNLKTLDQRTRVPSDQRPRSHPICRTGPWL